ncbi:hypothetical protein D1872_281620 [compost metagenome]
MATHEACGGDRDFCQHIEGTGAADLLHRDGAGIRVYFELFRLVIDAGISARPHRACVYLFLAVPRLAGGVPDRFGYVLKRTVCRVAGDRRSADWRVGRALSRCQYHGRRNGQNDFSAVYRHCLCCGGSGRERVGSVPLYR